MASAIGLNQTAVSRIWRAFGLQAHRVEHWKLSKGPLFVEKVTDIVGLHLDPPERAVVLCVDEKFQIQALDRSAPILPLRPGTPQRVTHDYMRHGTSSLFAALSTTSGKVIRSLHARHRAIEFKKFLIKIDKSDDYSTHNGALWSAPRRGFGAGALSCLGMSAVASCLANVDDVSFRYVQPYIPQSKRWLKMETKPISAAGYLECLATRVYAAVISDALDALGSTDRVLGPDIRPIGRLERPLIGRAATARAVPVDVPPGRPYATLLEAMDLLGPGEVWVVASGGQTRSAIFGGLLATAARARGAIGCIIDGAVRDSRELERLAFPTFATGYAPADSFGRDEVVEHGRPVLCAGVEIYPGDLIVADHDGVVAVPARLERHVIERALAKVDGEGEMRRELASGRPAAEAFAKYGIL